MSIIRGAIERRSLPTPPDVIDPVSPGSGYAGSWGQGMVWRGAADATAPSVSQSMRLSAVFACLRLLSEAVSTLPLDTYVRNGGVRKPYRPRPDYLSFQPPQQSRIEYLSQVMLSLLTDGNAYILTPRDRMGVPTDLIVMDPGYIEVSREQGVLRYRVQSQPLDPLTDLLHIKGMMLPGHIKGVSPIGYARETVGLGLSVQRFGASFFDNGALPSAVIESPQDFSPDAAVRFKEAWENNHRGIGNANRVGVLTKGAKLSKISIAPEDSQFIQTRSFQVPDIARIFGVPPHLIADASNSTSWGSGLAEQNAAFGQFSLRPWLERIEDAHSRLLTTHGLPNVFIKLNLDALLRASIKDRYDAYATGLQYRFLVPNEPRALEDLPPVPWGDQPLVPERITETGPAPQGALDLQQEKAKTAGTAASASGASANGNGNNRSLTDDDLAEFTHTRP